MITLSNGNKINLDLQALRNEKNPAEDNGEADEFQLDDFINSLEAEDAGEDAAANNSTPYVQQPVVAQASISKELDIGFLFASPIAM